MTNTQCQNSFMALALLCHTDPYFFRRYSVVVQVELHKRAKTMAGNVAMFCISLIMISGCLTPSMAKGLFKPVKKDNPLDFQYNLPTELVDQDNKEATTPRIAIHLPDPKDFCCDKKVIEEFNKSPDHYVETENQGGHEIMKVKLTYLKSVSAIEDRVRKVMLENFRVVNWVKIVTFFNDNLPFRKFLLGDQPLVLANSSFSKWNYSSYIDDIIFYASKKISLPDDVTPVSSLESEGIVKANQFELRWRQLVRHATEAVPERVKCEIDAGGPEGCLRQQFITVNERFKFFEHVIDLVREAFDAERRCAGYARLFNPVARWFA